MSDNFDLKKYLIENKATTNSRMLNEYFEKESDSLEQAFQKAGIDMSKPITAVKISGHAYSPGYETDDSMQVDPKSFLKKLEVEKAELEEEEGEAVIYDYDAADSYPAEDMNLPSTMVPKLSVMFSDAYEYVIYQEEGMTEMKKKHSKMMKENAGETWLQIIASYGGYHSEKALYDTTEFTGTLSDMKAEVEALIAAEEINEGTELFFSDPKVVAFTDYDGNFVFFVKKGAFPGPVNQDFVDAVEEYAHNEEGDSID